LRNFILKVKGKESVFYSAFMSYTHLISCYCVLKIDLVTCLLFVFISLLFAMFCLSYFATSSMRICHIS